MDSGAFPALFAAVKWSALTARRPAQSGADQRGIDLQFGQNPAQRVAVHAQFFRRLALVAPVTGQDLEDKPPLEFAHGFVVGDAACVHLGDKVVQLAFHRNLFPDPGLAGAIFQCFTAARFKQPA